MTLEETNSFLENRLEAALEERRTKDKELTTLKFKIDIVEGKNKELIKALNYIRSCDNATQSAAKAIEMLKKYENL